MMNLQPPASFSFAKSEEWPKWKRRFEQYRQASGLTGKGELRQVSTLLYCLGPGAEEVLDTTRIFEEDKQKYDKVVDEFDKYFKVKKNLIYERARFNQRSQLLDESADHFITEIHRLADNCEFGQMKDQLIRDRLVVGIRDSELSERLQLESDSLTLDKATKLIRQREVVRVQQEIMHKSQTKDSTSLDAVRQSTTVRRKLPATPQAPPKPRPPLGICRRCGSGTHPRHLCPAMEATCFKCNRRGHYSSQCLSTTVATISVAPPQPQEEDIKFLDTIEGAQENIWEIKVLVEDKLIIFKVDTGAEVTVISEQAWKSLQSDKPLQNPNTFLCGPDRTRLTVLGKIILTLTFNEKRYQQPVYVVKNVAKNLLAIKALSLLSHVDSVDKNIVSLYPTLFRGLGTFAQEYKIQLKANAQPFALNTPRNIALALRPKVHAELERMERLGVITRVSEPIYLGV